MSTAKPSKAAVRKPAKSGSLVRTNIVIDRDLVERVKRRTGAMSTREAVQKALEHVARPVLFEQLQALRDMDLIRPGYDPKDPMAEERYLRSKVAESHSSYSVPAKATKRRSR